MKLSQPHSENDLMFFYVYLLLCKVGNQQDESAHKGVGAMAWKTFYFSGMRASGRIESAEDWKTKIVDRYRDDRSGDVVDFLLHVRFDSTASASGTPTFGLYTGEDHELTLGEWAKQNDMNLRVK